MPHNSKDLVQLVRTRIKIDDLKAEARRHYQSYYALLNSRAPSCGRNLSEHMIPGLGEHKEKFNAAMDRLAALDPTCPNTRL